LKLLATKIFFKKYESFFQVGVFTGESLKENTFFCFIFGVSWCLSVLVAEKRIATKAQRRKENKKYIPAFS
jgi:hypothetical protein